jgi:hypothetical protein
MSANLLQPEAALAAPPAESRRRAPAGVARAGQVWLDWPLPEGPWRSAIDPDALPPACQVQLDARHFVNGRLLGFDLRQGLARWTAAGSDRAIALPFTTFRCLRLMALQPAESPDSRAWRPPPPAVPFRVEFTDGRAWNGTSYRVPDEAQGLFLFEPTGDVGNLRLSFVPRSAWRSLRIGRLPGRSGTDGRDSLAKPAAHRPANARLGQVLLELGLVDPQQLRSALAAQREGGGVPLGELLVRQGTLTREGLELALATKAGQPIGAIR